MESLRRTVNLIRRKDRRRAGVNNDLRRWTMKNSSKISWKEVSETMFKECDYKFGVALLKKKYDELMKIERDTI